MARRLAKELKLRFVDADDHHSSTNKKKMSRGLALNDTERAPWLAELSHLLNIADEQGDMIVLACSALRQSYRAVLDCPSKNRALLHLTAPREILAARLKTRLGHFAGQSLLDSQLTTLEAPEKMYQVQANKSHQQTFHAALACLEAQRFI